MFRNATDYTKRCSMLVYKRGPSVERHRALGVSTRFDRSKHATRKNRTMKNRDVWMNNTDAVTVGTRPGLPLSPAAARAAACLTVERAAGVCAAAAAA